MTALIYNLLMAILIHLQLKLRVKSYNIYRIKHLPYTVIKQEKVNKIKGVILYNRVEAIQPLTVRHMSSFIYPYLNMLKKFFTEIYLNKFRLVGSTVCFGYLFSSPTSVGRSPTYVEQRLRCSYNLLLARLLNHQLITYFNLMNFYLL